VPDFHPIDALKARVYLRQGRLSEALTWARERGLSVDDNLSYLDEFEHITLAGCSSPSIKATGSWFRS